MRGTSAAALKNRRRRHKSAQAAKFDLLHVQNSQFTRQLANGQKGQK
jgi:hypothetical protein